MVSLYISIYCDRNISKQDYEKIENKINYFREGYPYTEIGENLECYRIGEEPANCILHASVKFPFDDDISSEQMVEIQISALEYWISCLNEMHDIIPGLVWDVNLDDISLVWSDMEGWGFDSENES